MTVVLKNARSFTKDERFEEMWKELQTEQWDVICINETWRPTIDECFEMENDFLIICSKEFATLSLIICLENTVDGMTIETPS